MDSDLEITTTIHCELLLKDVRKAWLIQSCDYSFDTTIIDSILNYIKNSYPMLTIDKLNDNYFVSKPESHINIIDKHSTLSSSDFELYLGEILGFTCTNSNPKVGYSITYYKTIRETYSCGFGSISKPYQLMAFNCSCDNCDNRVKALKEQIEKVVTTIPQLSGYENWIHYTGEKHISVSYLMDKLLESPLGLTNEEKWEATNYLYNLGFSDKLHKIAMTNTFQYHNKTHIGILLTLLSHYKHYILDPFIPLQNSGKMDQVDKITSQWEKLLIEILEKTYITNV